MTIDKRDITGGIVSVKSFYNDEFLIVRESNGLYNILHKNNKRNRNGYHKQNSGNGFQTIAQAERYIKQHDKYRAGIKFRKMDRILDLMEQIKR